MSVFKDFPGLENREKIQGLSRTHKSPANFIQIRFETMEPWASLKTVAPTRRRTTTITR